MTQTPRRDVLKAAGTVVVVGGLAGCAGGESQSAGQQNESNETQNESQQNGGQMGAIRFAHASPDAPNVDVLVDEEPVIEDLAFREVSSYAELEPGTYQVQVTATEDQETLVFDEEIEIQAGVSNTAVAYGEASGGPDTGLTVDVLEDDLSDPGEGMSRVRLFHASPDAGDVNIIVTEAPEGGQQPAGNESQAGAQDNQTAENQTQDGQQSDLPQQGAVLFEAVGFGESTTQEIPAGEYSLGVVPAGDSDQQPQNETNGTNETQQDGQQTQTPVAEFDLTAESQTVYSAFAMGYVSPEEAPVDEPFEVVTVVEAEGGERADGGTDGGGMLTLTR
jgi:hypothetical protein